MKIDLKNKLAVAQAARAAGDFGRPLSKVMASLKSKLRKKQRINSALSQYNRI